MLKANGAVLPAIFGVLVFSCDFFKKKNSEPQPNPNSKMESFDTTTDRFRDCISRNASSPVFSVGGKPIPATDISPVVLSAFRQEQMQSYYQILGHIEESSLSLLEAPEDGVARVRVFAEAFRKEIEISEAEKDQYLDEAVAKGQLRPEQRKTLSSETVHQIVASKKRELLLAEKRQAGQSEMIDAIADRPCIPALPLQELSPTLQDPTGKVHVFMDLFNIYHRQDVIELIDKVPESVGIVVHFASYNIEGSHALASRISHCAQKTQTESEYRTLISSLVALPLEMRADLIKSNEFLNDKIAGNEPLISCVSNSEAIAYASALASAMKYIYFDIRPEVFVKGTTYLWRSNRYQSMMEILELFKL
jgi:hypothetical protein